MQDSFKNNFKQYFKPQENSNLLALITIDFIIYKCIKRIRKIYEKKKFLKLIISH